MTNTSSETFQSLLIARSVTTTLGSHVFIEGYYLLHVCNFSHPLNRKRDFRLLSL